ncbi:PTI1-like tyrosine-protein kinase [Raphanus sativus]|nr:PTI1-like tyrosine-protein kinase [Raphanus sativus]
MMKFNDIIPKPEFNNFQKVETEPSRKIFSLKEFHSATHICNYDNKLGEGRFGSVYWGQLSNSITRIKIAIRSAQALAYLYRHATPHIVKGDVRASNMLLDFECEPRVMDFGNGRLMPDDDEQWSY